ncbi:MAG: DUF3572 family protein [Hyphomicrobiales bacterium]|nr:DUF3572 family protein [Hyphomicrobiales bacterium]
MPRPASMTSDAAESLAIASLLFLADDAERFGRFLALTGIEAQSLRDASREPRFLLGVLDYLAADEALLLAFAAEREVAPQGVLHARDLLAAINGRDRRSGVRRDSGR